MSPRKSSGSGDRRPIAAPLAQQENPRIQKRSAETRRQILLAAATLFRDQGYKATTLRDIANALGMQAGSLYYHYNSKEEMLQAVLDDGISTIDRMVRESVASLAPDVDSIDRIRQAVHAHLRALLDTGDATTAYVRIYNQLPPTIKRHNHPRRLSYIAFWCDMFEVAVAKGGLRADLNVEPFVNFLIGAMARTTEWYSPLVPINEFADWVCAWMLDGVRAEKALRLRVAAPAKGSSRR